MTEPNRPPNGQDGSKGVAGERVLVVPREDLARAEVLPQGFSDHGCERFLDVVERFGIFRLRGDVEEDPSLKQIIPYAVVTFRGRVFLFRRSDRGGEVRLYRKLSIGIGGHINPEGVSSDRLVETGLLRELEEELIFKCPYIYRPIGLINDDHTPVGRVHMGIVYRVEASSQEVQVRETEILEGAFISAQELIPLLPDMETWSRHVAESIFLA